MPTYGYQCTGCKHEFSVFQAMKNDPIATCPECGAPVKRLLYPVGVVFKGSGWYINDSRKPDKSESPDKPADGAGASADGAKTEGAKTEAPGSSASGSEKSGEAAKPAPAPASAAADK